MRLNITIDEIRSLVLETLKNTPNTQYENICTHVADLAVQKGILKSVQNQSGFVQRNLVLDNADKDKVREIIWNLVIERVLTIGMDASNPQWPFLKLTEYGHSIVNSQHPVPHDPSGFLMTLKHEIPDLDPIILTYLTESLNTYNINALLSATIALGCASEKALLLLIEAYTNAIQDPKRRKQFEDKVKGRMIKRQFEEFQKSLTNLIGNMPADVSDNIQNGLLGIFEMFRNTRNDAGHPTGKNIPKEQVFAHLQVFITYCKKVYQLIHYFQTNPIA